MEGKENEAGSKSKRLMVHIGFSLVLLIVILVFNAYNDDSVINKLFTAAGYTYGPILGLFSFSLFTKRSVIDKMVIPICLISPVLCYIINTYSPEYLGGFQWGYMILALNGFLTYIGLMIFSKKKVEV